MTGVGWEQEEGKKRVPWRAFEEPRIPSGHWKSG